MENSIEELGQNVHKIILGDKCIVLVGTAHVSSESSELVQQIIEQYKPDTICVELCDQRLESLKDKNKWANTDLYEVIKGGKVYVLMAQLALASFQKRIAQKLDIEPGAEMHTAIRLASEHNAHIVAIDRNIKITLKRAWCNTGFTTFARIFGSLISSAFSREQIQKEQIEKLKQHDALTTALSELSEELPQIKVSLIDERDQYMATKISQAPGSNIVAVVGAGHVQGIINNIGKNVDIHKLDSVPQSVSKVKVFGYIISLLVIGLIVYAFSSFGTKTGVELAIIWIVAHSFFVGLGVLLTRAHPITILTAIVGAPVTSLMHTVAIGWLCGLVEAYFRKPKVKDLETIADDAISWRGLLSNQVSKILLIILFGNLGSILGTVVGMWLMVTKVT